MNRPGVVDSFPLRKLDAGAFTHEIDHSAHSFLFAFRCCC